MNIGRKTRMEKQDASIGLENDVFSPKGPHVYGNLFRVLGVDNHLITQMGFPAVCKCHLLVFCVMDSEVNKRKFFIRPCKGPVLDIIFYTSLF